MSQIISTSIKTVRGKTVKTAQIVCKGKTYHCEWVEGPNKEGWRTKRGWIIEV